MPCSYIAAFVQPTVEQRNAEFFGGFHIKDSDILACLTVFKRNHPNMPSASCVPLEPVKPARFQLAASAPAHQALATQPRQQRHRRTNSRANALPSYSHHLDYTAPR